MSRASLWGIGLVVAMAAAPAAAQDIDVTGLPLSCVGTEPFWDMTIAGGRALLAQPEGGPFEWAAKPSIVAEGVTNRWVVPLGDAATGGRGFAALDYTEDCSDGMSDRVFPFSLILMTPDGRVLAGCCGALD